MRLFYSWPVAQYAARLRIVVLTCLLCVMTTVFAAEIAVPALTARVTDLTKTLDAQTQNSLTQKLADLERRKGAQISVLIVPTTGGDTIEHYARRVFDQWALGRNKIDDGILFVVAKDDRHLRIEVGYGLEGAVPDILAGRIIREQVTPLFQQGDFNAGISAGVDNLIGLINGEALPPPRDVANGDGDEAPAGMLLPLAFMVFLVPPAMAALAAGLFVYFMFSSLMYAGLAAILALILSFVGRTLRGNNAMGRASRRGGALGGLGGGFGGGGFGGGSGGGFSGGGGGSGGGGASGSW